jgi:hypothetical protein
MQSYPALQTADDPLSPCLASLLRKPFPAQAVAAMGVAKKWERERSAAVIAECGTGKTLISLAALLCSAINPFAIESTICQQMHNVVTSRPVDVTWAILPTRNVDLTSLPVARIVLILKAELFLRTTGVPSHHQFYALALRPSIPALSLAENLLVSCFGGFRAMRVPVMIRVHSL